MARLLPRETSKGRSGVRSCGKFAVLSCLVTPFYCAAKPSHSFVLHQLSSKVQVSAEDGIDDSPSRCKAMQSGENMDICDFSPFLCLPVVKEFNGLPSRQSLPSFPPEKRWATAHSCSFYPGYHVADTANHRPVFSCFKI